jgi:hypothetical protein
MFLGLAEVLCLEVECLDEGHKYLTNERSAFLELSYVEWMSRLLFFTKFSLQFNVLNTELKDLGKQIML